MTPVKIWHCLRGSTTTTRPVLWNHSLNFSRSVVITPSGHKCPHTGPGFGCGLANLLALKGIKAVLSDSYRVLGVY